MSLHNTAGVNFELWARPSERLGTRAQSHCRYAIFPISDGMVPERPRDARLLRGGGVNQRQRQMSWYRRRGTTKGEKRRESGGRGCRDAQLGDLLGRIAAHVAPGADVGLCSERVSQLPRGACSGAIACFCVSGAIGAKTQRDSNKRGRTHPGRRDRRERVQFVLESKEGNAVQIPLPDEHVACAAYKRKRVGAYISALVLTRERSKTSLRWNGVTAKIECQGNVRGSRHCA